MREQKSYNDIQNYVDNSIEKMSISILRIMDKLGEIQDRLDKMEGRIDKIEKENENQVPTEWRL